MKKIGFVLFLIFCISMCSGCGKKTLGVGKSVVPGITNATEIDS